jgi:glycosyltransferase involved in cell wall biosynthesis
LRRLADAAAADVVLVNTGTLGDLVPALGSAPVVSYVHEQVATLRRTTFPRDLNRLLHRSATVVASSAAVRDELVSGEGLEAARVRVLLPFPPPRSSVPRPQARTELLDQVSAPADAILVGGCGGLYWAKDPDSFIEVASQVFQAVPESSCRFVWLGGELRDPERDRLQGVARERGLAGRVHFLPPREDPAGFFAGLDVFLVVSRSESFGVVALEAAREGVPVLCFETAKGLAEFVREDAGFVITGRDHATMAQRILQLALQPELRAALGAGAASRVEREHSVSEVAEQLLAVLRSAAEGPRSHQV